MEYCSRLPVVGADFGDQRQEDHMSHIVRRSRRIVIAVAVAALLGGTAMLAVSPAPASAERHPCPMGEFCLYFNEDANGGYYHFSGSDRNLNNDRYEGGDTGETVGNTSRYVWNEGVPATRATSLSTVGPATEAPGTASSSMTRASCPANGGTTSSPTAG
jgi:Peptidase inhibitor family I36